MRESKVTFKTIHLYSACASEWVPEAPDALFVGFMFDAAAAGAEALEVATRIVVHNLNYVSFWTTDADARTITIRFLNNAGKRQGTARIEIGGGEPVEELRLENRFAKAPRGTSPHIMTSDTMRGMILLHVGFNEPVRKSVGPATVLLSEP